MDTKSHDHILVCPLDWGLGHATRCIPLIQKFLRQGKRVSIAGNGRSLNLLKLEFPHLSFYELPDYDISYPKKGKHFVLHMGLQSQKILIAITKEKKRIKDILRSSDIDMILSDNRFGCYHKKCFSVFMSHQINIALPQGLNWLNKINQQFISKYNELWIPDNEGANNLSGKLSHGPNIKAKYLGVLSRFTRPETEIKIVYDYLAIVSGPEPQKSIFEETLRKKLKSSSFKCALVRGVPGSSKLQIEEGLDVYDHLPAEKLNHLINQSKKIICRAGYSSIMDLYTLEKEAILIPTPGQTEQEYLARYLNRRMGFTFIKQEELEGFQLSNELSNILSH